MTKSITMSFSIPIEFSILIEECMEDEKITRSELIKKALEFYFNIKESNKENNTLIRKTYEMVLELTNLIKK